MDFLSQYLLANSGNMVPARFTMWAGVFVLASTMGRRFYVDHEHFKIRPQLYITLVGEQGIRKSTAKNAAKAMFTETFPDFPLGSSIMSREQIVLRMAEPDSLIPYVDENNETVLWTPRIFFINELKNFMSVNPVGMVEFLTDMYDVDFFDSDVIKHGLKKIENPFINILACETPDWIIEKLRMKVTSGGFSRRMLYVFHTERVPRITFPHKSQKARDAEQWCIYHLQQIVKMAGQFKWTEDGRKYFDNWFINLPYPEDKVLAGFYEAKDVLAIKIAMCLAMSKPEPKLILDKETIEYGVSFLESIEDNLGKLTIAVGRNDLAVPQARLVQYLVDAGGWMPEKKFHKHASVELNEQEYRAILNLLKNTDQIKLIKTLHEGDLVWFVLTIPKYVEMVKKGDIKLQ